MLNFIQHQNVPVGGGCRKSRRGKSIRAGVSSRSSVNNGAMLESTSSFPGPAGVSTSIDLVAVYANFLNQKPQPQSQIQIPDLLYDYSFDQKHQYTTTNHQLITSMNGRMNSSQLPPLPGEDVATSEGMVGSSFDLMFPNHIIQSTDRTAGIEQDSKVQLNGNGNPFSMLNLEAIFRP
ncbi:Dof zinc finger protein DOF3.5 [Abeliophyllum distichum]|uniref:Dof zinc finger protein DOF3.5 n=1 Tax=Abeliophyllum distichum TaxID=126358 RepID=A0ABD1V8J1_9LAMI